MERFSGWGSGLLGVLIFSGSLPATRLGVGGFDPLFLTTARAAIAAGLGLILLLILRQPRPEKEDLVSLGIIALGVVIGFPLLTALALQEMSSAYSTVYIGLLPLATALFGVVRGGERPKPLFWAFSLLGAAGVAGFALFDATSTAPLSADLLMVAAILVCGLAYAEGATLSRKLGGWQVISWALVVSLPVTAAVAWRAKPVDWGEIPLDAWAGLIYVTLFSMLLGFLFWYRGLAKGGIAGVGQLQLLQPFFGLLIAGLILGEQVEAGMVVAALLVVGCVAGAKRFA